MFTNIFILTFFYLMLNQLTYTKKLEEIFTCANETECDELTEKDISQETLSTPIDSIYNTTSVNTSTTTSSSVYPIQTTKLNISSIQKSHKIKYNDKIKNHTIHKVQSTICECDLTVSSCNINCCCDKDCNEFHLTTFSHCENHAAELYDKRYCYHRNFIERNNTPFILEKLANNLFCILYDNLPPTYSINNDLNIKTNKDLKEAINPNRLTWRWKDQLYVPEYNNPSLYKDDDIIWKIQSNYVEPLEILQSGFTELCSFKKTVKYLREWKEQCLQTELINTNEFLFPAAFNNFTVIISPHLLNETYIKISNESCPRNVCLSVNNYYCKYSWKTCNNDIILGSCSNGICYNIVTGVKYLIIHNGSMGINSFNVYFNIGNVSRSFYQQFEVSYEWADVDKEKIFSLSGNPGYIFGKPLISGVLKINKTNNVESRYINFNKTNGYFTLPIATRHGECNDVNRYVLAFGEDVKLKCSASLQTNNFSTASCIELQNRIMFFALKDSLLNVTQINQYSIYISKSGNFSSNNTADWAQILLDRIPQNIVTGQLINGRLYCSGLITSTRLDILYSALAKPKTLTNYNILGVGITFSEESDVFWSKCMTENCTDMLKVDVINYVTFHDVSKPSKYYFAGSPNLDLTLPYDFFYPFLSRSKCIEPSIFLIIILLIISLHNFLY